MTLTMLRRLRNGTLLVPLALGLFGAGSVHAEAAGDSATAEGLYANAKALMAEGRLREACPKLEESQRLDPASGTLINLASCYERTGRLASAWTTYLEAAASAKTTGNAERESKARELATALAPRLSRLVIRVPPASRVPGLMVLRDGTLVGPAQWGVALPADEGTHTLVAKARGFTAWSSSVVVQGEHTTADATVPKLVEDEHATPHEAGLGARRTIALVAGGVGVVGLGIGTVYGIKSKSDHDEAAKFCSGSVCTETTSVDAGNAAYAAGNIATIALIAGAVGLAGGAVLWFTTPSAPSQSSMQLGLSPGVIQARGTW